MKNLLLIPLFILFLACANKKSQQTESGIPSQLIDKQWSTVNELNKNGLQAFKPSNLPLPPSRGRETILFKSGGTVEYKHIAPSCGLDTWLGTWKVENKVINVSVSFKEVTRKYSFEPISVSDTIIYMKMNSLNDK